MAYSYDDYIGNGTNTVFSVTFPYLKKQHVTVEVDGVSVSFTWISAGSISTTAPPTMGAAVRVKRTTPKEPLVTWFNGSFDRAESRNLANLQAIYLAQENYDSGVASLKLPPGEEPSEANLTLPEDRAGRLLGFDLDKKPIALHPPQEEPPTGVFLVDAYGAVGDGVTDDTEAVSGVISLAPAGSTIKFTNGKRYYLRSLGTITKPLTIDGDGCSITCDVTNSGINGSPLFCFRGSKQTQHPVNAFSLFDSSIFCSTPADAANYEVDDTILLECNDATQKWDASGTCYVGKKEITSVKAVNPATGEITLSIRTSFDMSVSVTVSKIIPLIRPKVINFSEIHEIYSGSTYSGPGQGENAPNIIDMAWCQDARVEYVTVNGWAVEAVAIGESDGAYVHSCRFLHPYDPTTGGVSVGVKVFQGTRNVHVTRCIGRNTRHLVDWVMCLDCSSSENVVNNDPGVDTAAFVTHGFASRRIYSINDTVIGLGGWSFGNASFSADYDSMIVNPTYYGDDVFGGGIQVPTSNGIQIVNPNVYCSSIGIRIGENASRVSIKGGQIRVKTGLTASRFGIYVWGGVAHPCRDISIDGVDIICDELTTGIQFDSAGSFSVKNCRVSAGVCIYGCNQVSPDDLVISDNHFTAEGNPLSCIRLSTSGAYPPTAAYVVRNNIFKGAVTDVQCRVTGTNNLVLTDNRCDDVADANMLAIGVLSVNTITQNGGRVERNGWSGDQPTLGNTVLDQPNILYMLAKAAYSCTVGFYRNSARWLMRMNADAESGSNAGSNFEISARDDSGNQIDIPFLIQRVANGNIYLQRGIVIHGASTLGYDVNHLMRTPAGRTRDISFQSGVLDRWRFRVNNTAEGGSNAGSDFQVLAYTDAGALIDMPLTIVRSASGQVAVNRQFKTTGSRIVKVLSVVSAAATTVVSTTDEVVVVTGSTTHTLTLPAAATGFRLCIKNRSTGTVTVNRAGADTIDGGTTFNLTAGQSTMLIANGADWCRMANA